MLDATETTEFTTDAPSAEAAVTKTQRIASEIDHAAATVRIADEAYAAADLPEPVRAALLLIGLRTTLIASDNRPATFSELASGKIPGRAPAKPKELDHRRLAIAIADTDKLAKEQGLKVSDPARKAILDDMKQKVAGYDAKAVKDHHKRAPVMIAYAKLVGEQD